MGGSSSKAESRRFEDSYSSTKFRHFEDSTSKDSSKCLQSLPKKVTFYRWKIYDSKRQWKIYNLEKKPTMFSNCFTLNGQSPIKFALYVDTQLDYNNKKSFGVAVQNIDKSYQIKVSTKIWIEGNCGNTIINDLVQEHIFNKADNRCGFDGFNITPFYNIFINPFGNGYDLNICCELTELGSFICDLPMSDLELSRKFNQKQWVLFEQNVHDAVIKVEDTEFKVLKSFFIAQSEVFKFMFESKFKEGNTSIVEIKDISKQTMQNLIKWLYTGQVSVGSKIEELFGIADKYDIKLLKKTCVEIMLLTFDSKNVFSRLVLAFVHNSDQLTEASLKFATLLPGIDWAKFTMSSDWVDLVRKKPKIADELAKLVQEKMVF